MQRFSLLTLAALAVLGGCSHPQKGKAEVVGSRIVTDEDGHTRKILVDWRNVGETPIRYVLVTIEPTDAQGHVLHKIGEVNVYWGGAPVAPGETYHEPENEGITLDDENAVATGASVTIVSATEDEPPG